MGAPEEAAKTPTSRATSISNVSRRRHSEFTLPDGKKVLVASPAEAAKLKDKYASVNNKNAPAESAAGAGATLTIPEPELSPPRDGDDFSQDGRQVEIVIHGSPEHHAYLQHTHQHHSARRDAFRERHGGDFEEWERVRDELDVVADQLAQLANHASSLDHNFTKFGYAAHLRATGDGAGGNTPPKGAGVASGAASLNDDASSHTAGWHDHRQGGTTMKLFQRPIVKQYFHRGLLWRAGEETKVMSFELFFDLLYVGIIAINGDHILEYADGKELLRFVVTFTMSWKLWSDLQTTVMWFEVDDIAQKFEVLFLMACLLGLTTNMTSTFDSKHDTYSQLTGFYLAARLFTGIYYGINGYLLPLIRGTMISQIVLILISSAILIGSIYMDMPNRLALTFTALVIDLWGNLPVVAMFRYGASHQGAWARRLERFYDFFPAVNIEHKVERTNQFIALVLGHSVLSVMFQNTGYGLNAFLGKAILGLVQAFVFNWIYFEIDGANIHLHAIRRKVVWNFVWTTGHLFFVMSYIPAAAALTKLVAASDCPDADPHTLNHLWEERSEHDVSLGIRLFFGVGLGLAIFSTLLISMSHEHKHPPLRRISKPWRLANRGLVGVILCVLPAVPAERLNSLQLVALTCCLVFWVLLFEIWGVSCRDEAFWGRGECTYSARCSRRALESAMKEDGKVDVVELGRNEKTAVPTIG